MLCQTILASRADYEQGGGLPKEDNFCKVLNDLRHATYDPDEMMPIEEAAGTPHARMEIERFLVRMGATQLPSQEPRALERAGRLVAMLEELPRRYPDRVPERQREEVNRVVPRVEEVLGARVSDLVCAFQDILSWQQLIHGHSLKALSTRVTHRTASCKIEESAMQRAARIIFEFLVPEPLLNAPLVFTIDRMLTPFNAKLEGYATIARPRVEAFMRLAARSADQLRQMLSEEAFKIGHPGKRLSPLERFPIVRVDSAVGEPRYVVPNFRHLAKSFNAVIDFALHNALGRDYEHARGALFHLYLRQLVEDRLPQIEVIPEVRYDKARGAKDSADLTLIDRQAGRIVAVEVKGRQINLETRLTLGDAELDKNLCDAFNALRKLPSKVAALRAIPPDFEQWRSMIAATADSPPVLVAVIREGLHLLPHLLRQQASLDPGHPLHGLTEPYCLLSADAFEKAVEVSQCTNRPLATLLEEHYRCSGLLDPATPAADSFGEGLLPHDVTFAGSFLKIPEWATA